jgi:hypothetical protein
MREMVATVEQTKANVLDQMNASKACLRASIGEPPLLRSQAQQKLLQMSPLLLELTQYTELNTQSSSRFFQHLRFFAFIKCRCVYSWSYVVFQQVILAMHTHNSTDM